MSLLQQVLCRQGEGDALNPSQWAYETGRGRSLAPDTVWREQVSKRGLAAAVAGRETVRETVVYRFNSRTLKWGGELAKEAKGFGFNSTVDGGMMKVAAWGWWGFPSSSPSGCLHKQDQPPDAGLNLEKPA